MSEQIKQKIETKIWEIEEAESNEAEEIYVLDWLKIRLLSKDYTRENLEQKVANLKAFKFRNARQACLLSILEEILTS